ncbi:MAG: hypothetical protein GY862_15895 [Gammaproteobacteria bacterium]|nr:hypothetical protein [Gammaproteobacteria bacterium]
MDIKHLNQYSHYVFNVNGLFYRIEFERDDGNSDWAVRVRDVEQSKNVYSKMLDGSVNPDVELAEQIVKTYASGR